MAEYGLRLKDALGNSFQMTPNAATIVSAGRLTLSNSLNGDYTYGSDIDLPASNIPVADLGVIVSPVLSVNSVVYARYIDGSTLYYNTFYANSASTYYTRNDATGVMTSWSAGNRTADSKSTWDPVLSVYPIAFWDKIGATTFSKIRLFAATAYLVRDTNADTNFSLAGTATASGYNVGTPSSMNDNNEGTNCGSYCYVDVLEPAYTQRTVDFVGDVTFASNKQINSIELAYIKWANLSGGSAYGSWSVYLYYDSDYHEIMNGSWTYPSLSTAVVTQKAYGRWNNVSQIRCTAHLFAQKSTGYTAADSEFYVCELRAYGSAYTDDNENKIVYSIGDAGVSQVDYLITMKKYNY